MNGGRIVFATDDWFAVAENLLKTSEAEWREGIYTECGKWMDGWETRRRRTPGHDWLILKLGVPGVLRGVTVDTAFFTGNFAPRFSLQAATLSEKEENLIPYRESHMGNAATPEVMEQIQKLGSEGWTEIVPVTPLRPGYPDTRLNRFEISNECVWTHVRLNIFPDGGVARLHLYGQARPRWEKDHASQVVDLMSMMNGAVCLGFSDAHYGHPKNLIRPGRGVNMGDGWETARRLDRPCILQVDSMGILQVTGSEWAVFRLGHTGIVNSIEVDTNHFKGNYPDSILIEGGYSEEPDADESILRLNATWAVILPSSKLGPHRQHVYGNELVGRGPYSHVRITIAPDGGLSRVRFWGQLNK